MPRNLIGIVQFGFCNYGLAAIFRVKVEYGGSTILYK
jgi:hypothetical protein